MKIINTYIICAIVAVCFLAGGCAYQRKITLKPVGLPEEIYVTPCNIHCFGVYKVGIFKFSEPASAPETGKIAAIRLHQQLLQDKIFSNMQLELNVEDIREVNLIDIARTKKYDVIITGKIMYYFEGDASHSSRIDEEIRVLRIGATTTTTIWHAKAMEIASPVPSSDYIFAQGRSAPAPSAAMLMTRNSQKFCNMFITYPTSSQQ